MNNHHKNKIPILSFYSGGDALPDNMRQIKKRSLEKAEKYIKTYKSK
jgi:hypothetical protein